jgi:hypothetical protein
MKSSRSFAFDKLRRGQLGISAVSGASFAEAAEFCLQHHGHAKPVLINLTGDFHDSASLEWKDIDARLLSRTYGDLRRAAEDGAYGIAIVLATETTGIPSVMKSPQGTGFDYWLTSGDERNNFFEARLEVSGLLQGSQSEIKEREKTKVRQTQRSDDTRLPAYILIVEFGAPEARIVKRFPGEAH